MATTPPPPLDPVTVAASLFAAWLAPPAAEILGAYFVIIIASFAGAGWALMRKPKKGVVTAVGFVLLLAVTSTLMTVGASELVNHYLHLESHKTLLVPVALLIAGIGHDWPRVVPWLANVIFNLISQARGGGNVTPPPTAAEQPSVTATQEDTNDNPAN